MAARGGASGGERGEWTFGSWLGMGYHGCCVGPSNAMRI